MMPAGHSALAVAVDAVEHERRGPQRRARVHDRPAADDGAGEHVEPGVAPAADEGRLVAGVHAEQVVGRLALAEVGVGDARAALEDHDPEPGGGVAEGGDGAAEARADDGDVARGRPSRGRRHRRACGCPWPVRSV